MDALRSYSRGDLFLSSQPIYLAPNLGTIPKMVIHNLPQSFNTDEGPTHLLSFGIGICLLPRLSYAYRLQMGTGLVIG